MEHQQNHTFSADTGKLLKLMIHSLYSNKEIFLRELVSNAADAADKLRFKALSDGSLFENDADLRVRLSFDADAKTITISDNGIGMTRDEVIEHLGTIAKSGTSDFFEQLSGDQVKDSQLIGQFGVGFYSAFIVADKVTVNTRKAGEEASQGTCWSSAGEADYSVADIEKRFTLSKCKGVTHSALLQLWPVAASDNVTVRRVDLDPKRCGGHTFRYRIEGWGLIQLYLGGTGPKGIVASHTNHNSEKRARAWEGESDSLGPVSRWDWREVVRVSSQINRHIRTNLAVGKQQSRPILPEAAVAEASGIPLL